LGGGALSNHETVSFIENPAEPLSSAEAKPW